MKIVCEAVQSVLVIQWDNVEVCTHSRLLLLSFCLSLRIFDASPDSIASGAFDVTDCPEPPNSAGTSTLGPSLAFFGLSSCCVLEGRDCTGIRIRH